MKPLDLNSLLYVIGGISFLFALLMLLFYKHTPTIKGPWHWAMGSFSAVIGSLLLAFYPLVPGYAAFVLGGVFTVLALSFYLEGIYAFKNAVSNRFMTYGIVILQVLFGTLFYTFLDMPNLRMASFSTICATGSLLIVAELLKPVQKNYRVAFILCSIVFAISVATSLFRVIYIIAYHPGDALSPTPANQLFYFMANVTQALLLFSFLLLISLKISDRLEMKVQAQRKIFSVIAHDLSGPVCTVTQMLELANNDNDLEDSRKKYIYKEVERLSESTYHLLQNLLLWSRNQLEDLAPVVRKFDLNKVLVENIDFLRKIAVSKEITIHYEPSADLQCMADSRMIDTVVRNLISNAIKFTNPGGKVTITCESKKEQLILKIADSGIGMNSERLHKVFHFNESNPKSGTSGEKGTGLGLYICKEFVEGNHGSIQISSKENVGTEVTISLPMV